MKLACRKHRRYVKIKSKNQREMTRFESFFVDSLIVSVSALFFSKQTSTNFYYDLK